MSTTQGNRILYLDFLRGIAVLGLLLMNMPSMGIPEMGYVSYEPDLLGDKIYSLFQALFFDGRFRSLFCLLFSIGLYLQYLSYQNKNLNSYVILKSRLNWLLVFGLIHCIFLWPGDILILYALTGMYLMSKLDWPAKKLIKRGLTFFAIGLIISAAQLSLIEYYSEGPTTRHSTEYLEALAVIKGSYWEVLKVNTLMAFAYVITFPILALFYFGGVMMLSLGLYKSGQLQHGFNQKQLFLLIIITLVFSTIDAYFAVFRPDIHYMMTGLIGSISGLSMALLIWHLVLTLKLADSTAWLSTCLQRTGRMAFSFYILQSIVMAGIFRYLFPELNETFTLTDYALVSVSFILLQMLIANRYLRHFKQGPLEKLWRYLVRRSMIKASQSTEQSAKLSASSS
ncbi:DUF418 domain-containing protein [Thalassotalea sp. LPB0316]|uniref:DUF418 domain-containing protein n=1 Tax=Thalassotalea sp. LPB0316 TaxID=2769490 RepID=UPI0018688E6B|nr:DUF418 domain-containing protein [Thalassotalea sp. LPB0316]QOL26805.1 DUF418 domain-containing protein [Thalassotalea sp. LPB0316]